MKDQRIDVIATTISGSVKDWGKVKQIIPLFNKYGINNVELFTVDSHNAAREKTHACIDRGGRLLISAGGSGTFNSVLEGCCDSGVPLDEITLGFLRKGSADLIGKVLGMPDTIEDAIKVFVDSIHAGNTVPCDVLLAESEAGNVPSRHFAGYAGAEIFGEIPCFTENRYVKYYKGLLSQFFGDLGPFFVGTSLATLKKVITIPVKKRIEWDIFVDNEKVAKNYYQAFIIVNGDLGKDLPFAKSVPLGSGDFYMFALRDIGTGKLIRQIKHTWDASIMIEAEKWGFETYRIKNLLKLRPQTKEHFNVNVDGATMACKDAVRFSICDQINLISNPAKAGL